MKTNRRNRLTLHSAIKKTRGSGKFRRAMRIVFILFILAVFGVLAVLGWKAYVFLRTCWEEQCVITNIDEQVKISATPHVKAEHIREWFSLTNGCNLAHLDLKALHARAMQDHPIVKEMIVARHFPNRIEIFVEERKPIARVNLKRATGKNDIDRWDVVDADGIVFEANRKETRNLPVIREKKPSAKRGERISGRALVALRVVELCDVRNVVSFSLPEIATDSPVYLKATTENYSAVRIAWNLLDDARDEKQPALTQILTNMQQLMNQRLYPDRVMYTITDLDRIAVKTYE